MGALAPADWSNPKSIYPVYKVRDRMSNAGVEDSRCSYKFSHNHLSSYSLTRQ